MELEEWIRTDMRRYVKAHEPVDESPQPIRQEDFGILGNRDYETLIKKSLSQDRFRHASALFKELRQRFLDCPLDHQEERRSLYRIIQKCYKLIYDYVADRHKTARIIAQLTRKADPFNQNVEAVDLSKAHLTDLNIPKSVEQAMLRDDSKDELPPMTVIVNQQAAPEPLQTPPEQQISLPEPPAPLEEKTPEKETSSDSPPLDEQPTDVQKEPPADDLGSSLLSTQKEFFETLTPSEHAQATPEWHPPAFSEEPEEDQEEHMPEDLGEILDRPRPDPVKEVEEHPDEHAPGWKPPKTQDEVNISLSGIHGGSDAQHTDQGAIAENLLAEARARLVSGDTKAAQEKLIEARFALEQQGGNTELAEKIGALEATVASKLHPEDPVPSDHEVFSTTYLRGIQAMSAGDYAKARDFFLQRVQQAPYDRAAQIRLTECMEVLDG